MDKLISFNQSSFLKGKFLVNGVVVVKELVDLAKKTKKSFFIFKMDFDKVYDLVSWTFMDYMLSLFGFNDKWRLNLCLVFLGNLAVLVNGFLTQEIIIQMGFEAR